MTWLRKINKDDLHPGLVRVMDRTLAKLEDEGAPHKVYSGLRTFAEQDGLYAKGRTEPGRIVTKARAGESMHNYGLATDSAPLNLDTEKTWDVHWPDPDSAAGATWYLLEKCLMKAALEIDAEEDDGLDFEWGGRWRFRDVPHIQVRTTIRELRTGWYPTCRDVEWLVRAHTTFLFHTGWWMDRRVQFLLNQLGHDAGAVDGIIGQRTRSAIGSFTGGETPGAGEAITRELVEALVRAA